ncbi:MAG: hypothetical protein IKK21_07955 [Clostridia bacterium]|nr:hypothetical protein [Clostridia bacterium]
MLWLIVLLLATPVRLTAELRWLDNADLSLCWRIWGIPFRQRIRLYPAGGQQHLTMQTGDLPPREPPPEKLRRALAALGTLLRTDKARRWLPRVIHLERLDALFSPGMQDASLTALVSGLTAGLAAFVSRRHRQRIRLRVQPDFFTGRTSLQARCIIFFHLGSLLPAAAMVLAAALMEAREHRIPPLPKEV